MNVLALLLSFILLQSNSIGNENTVRSSYHVAIDSEKKLKKLVKEYEDNDQTIIQAYVGLSRSTLAKYAYLPTTKLSLFNKGKAEIEGAIKAQPENVELKYIRLMVQLNAPEFLGYSKQRAKDLEELQNGIHQSPLSKYWKKKFINNLIQTKYISSNQKLELQRLIKKLS